MVRHFLTRNSVKIYVSRTLQLRTLMVPKL